MEHSPQSSPAVVESKQEQAPQESVRRVLRPTDLIGKRIRTLVASAMVGVAGIGGGMASDNAEAGGIQIQGVAQTAATIGLGMLGVNSPGSPVHVGVSPDGKTIRIDPNNSYRPDMQIGVGPGAQEALQKMGVKYDPGTKSLINTTNPMNHPIPLSSRGNTKSISFTLAGMSPDQSVVSFAVRAIAYDDNTTSNSHIENAVLTIKKLKDGNGQPNGMTEMTMGAN